MVTFAEEEPRVGAPSASGTSEPADNALQQLLRRAFSTFDQDQSGTLTASEMMGILTRSGGGKPMSRNDAQKLIDAFDVNGDGMLNLEEFVAAFTDEVGVMGLVHVHANRGSTYAYDGGAAPVVPQAGGSRQRYSEYSVRAKSTAGETLDDADFDRAATRLQKVQRGRQARRRASCKF